MQDWSSASGGFYQYARSHGGLDRAFDRLATWLRRPAAYALAFETAFQEETPPSRKPGSLRVVAPTGETGATLTAMSPEVGIEIILDTSGSMLDSAGGQRRIDVARSVLLDLVETRIPAGAPVALRVLGDRDRPCGTQLAVPLAPLDPARVRTRVEGLQVDAAADTPIGAAIASVPGDLAGSVGTKIVLLITDSQEVWPHPDLCGVDPADAIRDLRRHGIDACLNIGYGRGATKGSRCATGARRRRLLRASVRDELAKAIERAGRAVRVLDDAGNGSRPAPSSATGGHAAGTLASWCWRSRGALRVRFGPSDAVR
jgi:hypothetical protein